MYGCLCGQIEKVLVKNMVVSEASTFLQWINQLLLLTLWGSSGFLIYNLVFCQKMKQWNSKKFHPLTGRNYTPLEINRHLQGSRLWHYSRCIETTSLHQTHVCNCIPILKKNMLSKCPPQGQKISKIRSNRPEHAALQASIKLKRRIIFLSVNGWEIFGIPMLYSLFWSKLFCIRS